MTAIAAAGFHSIALKNGKVIIWGGSSMPSDGYVPPAAGSGVTAISTGDNHNLVLK